MYVLGIDAGGTKTVCYLADAQGTIVGEGRGGGANLQAHGELEVEKVLHAVIEEAVGDRAVLPAAVCLGVAGIDRAEDDRIVRGIMRRFGFRVRTLVVNDALVALVAGVGDEPGVVLIAGTGSIAYGVNQDGFAARAGGWGYMLGDEGSGYWVGRKALAAVVRAADGRGPKTALTPLMLRPLQRSAIDGLVRRSTTRACTARRSRRSAGWSSAPTPKGTPWRPRFCALPPDELTRAAASVVERLGMRGDAFRTVLAGGMFRVIPWLVDEVAARLAEVAPRAGVLRLEVEPAMGAVHLALKELRGGARIPRYLDSVSTTPA